MPARCAIGSSWRRTRRAEAQSHDATSSLASSPALRRAAVGSVMLEVIRRLGIATRTLHRGMNDTADAVGRVLVDAFHFVALFVIGATTVWSAVAAFIGMVAQGRASLEDILLLFMYLEIVAMVGIYFKTTQLPVRYLIYIAITALGRVLIEIVGAEHRTGIDILVVAGAILLLSFAVLVLRFGSHRFPSDTPAAVPARSALAVKSDATSKT
jgi:protein PsiE